MFNTFNGHNPPATRGAESYKGSVADGLLRDTVICRHVQNGPDGSPTSIERSGTNTSSYLFIIKAGRKMIHGDYMFPLFLPALLGLYSGLVAAAANTTYSAASAQIACQSLIWTLGHVKVQTAGPLGLNLQYEQSAKGAWNVFNQLDGASIPSFCCSNAHFISFLDPTCIVFPANASDVVVAMKAIRAADADYAVRGGGHSAMPGWNTYGALSIEYLLLSSDDGL